MHRSNLAIGICIILFQSVHGYNIMDKLLRSVHKYTKTNITGIMLCREGEPATSGTVQLYDDDFFKDDLVASVDLAKTKQGAFELSGEAKDYKYPNPDPELYLKIVKVCDVDCTRIELKGYPKMPDGSIDLDLGPIDMSNPDFYDMNACK